MTAAPPAPRRARAARERPDAARVPLARGARVPRARGVRRRCTGWSLLDPPAPERALYALGAAALRDLGLLGAGRLDGRARPAAAIAASVVALALALLGGGVADELLRPDRWGELASGISRGIESLPGVRVPYRGVDQWTRTVIPLGGTVLVTAAALPPSGRAAGGIGLPGRRADAAGGALRGARGLARLRERVPARRRCWRCSCSRSCGSRSCASATPARRPGGRRRSPCWR